MLSATLMDQTVQPKTTSKQDNDLQELQVEKGHYNWVKYKRRRKKVLKVALHHQWLCIGDVAAAAFSTLMASLPPSEPSFGRLLLA